MSSAEMRAFMSPTARQEEFDMAKGQTRGNREAKKPKKKKEAAAAPVLAKGLPAALELAGKPKKKS
ncbi:MAG: hypothetical protein EON92_16395 [Burkholderiales bacterium]|nr:MAG: hypothetical protein EON92_16395 [Burkholderiales bacterium]